MISRCRPQDDEEGKEKSFRGMVQREQGEVHPWLLEDFQIGPVAFLGNFLDSIGFHVCRMKFAEFSDRLQGSAGSVLPRSWTRLAVSP